MTDTAKVERRTIFRGFFVWNFEKEEQWLNDMAMDGWALEGVGFLTYHFVRCEIGEYTIRMEMHEHDTNYISFMEETGAEYIGRIVQWIYFRRKSELGRFDIFSDIDSRIAHLNKISKMLLAVGIANILLGVVNSINVSSMGFINLLCGCLLMYALGRIRGKEEALKKERQLHE